MSAADEITKLAELRAKGLLTQEEFDAGKSSLLGSGNAPTKKPAARRVALLVGGFVIVCGLVALVFVGVAPDAQVLNWPETASLPELAAVQAGQPENVADVPMGDSLLNHEHVFGMNRTRFIALCNQRGGSVGEESQITFCYSAEDADVGATFKGNATSTVLRWNSTAESLALLGAMRDTYGNEDTRAPAGQCVNHIWVRDYYYGVMTCPGKSVFLVSKR